MDVNKTYWDVTDSYLDSTVYDSGVNSESFSLDNTTILYNMSDIINTTIAVAIPYWLDDECLRFNFFFNTVGIGTICLIGLVFNTLSIVVLRQDRHNEVATFLLQALAIADNCVLVISIIILSVYLGTSSIPEVWQKTMYSVAYLKKYINPIGYMTHCFAIWTTVLLAINRYIAVCKPFAVHTLLTITKARIQLFIVILLSILFNIPRFFQYDVVFKNNSTIPLTIRTDLEKNKLFTIIYINVFHTALLFIFPLFLMLILNGFVIHNIQSSRRRMSEISRSYSGSQENNITLVMGIIVFEILICHLPDRILTVFKYIYLENTTHAALCPHLIDKFSHICNILIIINSSTNFFIYCALRPRFRKILCRLLCRFGRPGLDRRLSDSETAPLKQRHRSSSTGGQHDQVLETTTTLISRDAETMQLVNQENKINNNGGTHKDSSEYIPMVTQPPAQNGKVSSYSKLDDVKGNVLPNGN